MFASCPREMWSNVNSSPNSVANLEMSSLVTVASPDLTRFIKSYNLSALSRVYPLLDCFKPFAITRTVSCRNRATSSLALSFFFSCSSCFKSFRNVDGSIPGKTFSATGRRSSMNGMSRNAANGTRRKTSAVVRVICLRSRRVSCSPLSVLNRSLDAILTSTHRSFVPIQ